MHACDVTSITTTEPVYDTVNMCRLKTVVQSIFTFREAMTTAKTEIEEAFASEFSDVCCLAFAEGNQSLRDSCLRTESTSTEIIFDGKQCNQIIMTEISYSLPNANFEVLSETE